MKNTVKRVLSLMLVLVMVSMMLPMEVLATAGDGFQLPVIAGAAPQAETEQRSSVNIKEESIKITVGDKLGYQLNATVDPAGTKITWSSSDTSVATVSNGMVIGKKAGTVTITATAGGLSDTCEVTVEGTSGKHFVYIYLNATNMSNYNFPNLQANSSGWYTMGYVTLDSAPEAGEGAMTGTIHGYVDNAIRFNNNTSIPTEFLLNAIERYHLFVSNRGANDYVGDGNNAWHLDLYATVASTTYPVKVNYINENTGRVMEITTAAYPYGASVNPEWYIKDINGYTFDYAAPETITVSGDASKDVLNLYYKKNGTISVSMNSQTVLYDGKEHSLSAVIAGGPAGLTLNDLHVQLQNNRGTESGVYNGTVSGDAKYTAGNKTYDVIYRGGTLTINLLVAYKLNGGTSATSQLSYEVQRNTQRPRIENPTQEGYVLSGWTDQYGGRYDPNSLPGNIDRSYTFTAQWSKKFNLTGRIELDPAYAKMLTDEGKSLPTNLGTITIYGFELQSTTKGNSNTGSIEGGHDGTVQWTPVSSLNVVQVLIDGQMVHTFGNEGGTKNFQNITEDHEVVITVSNLANLTLHFKDESGKEIAEPRHYQFPLGTVVDGTVIATPTELEGGYVLLHDFNTITVARSTIDLWATYTKGVVINYVANEGGTVSRPSEAVGLTGNPQGSQATAKDGYTFVNWTDASGEVVGTDLTFIPKKNNNQNVSATYYANFTQKYTVTWKNEDGSTLEVDENVEYGTMPHYDGKTPTKEADPQYTYEFSGWSPEVHPVTGEETYVAQYEKTLRQYDVTFVDENETTVLKEATKYDYGTSAESIVKPDNPTKAATAEFNYAFAGWTPAITDVTGNATYKATYTETRRTYPIVWKDEDGTVLETDENVTYGTMPVYDGETPTKEADAQYAYEFSGWTPTVVPVTGETEYVAVYEAIPIDYTVTFVDRDSTEEKTCHYNGTVTAPADPTQEGYAFGGWKSSIDGEIYTREQIDARQVTQNVTYTAQWNKIYHVYYYNGNHPMAGVEDKTDYFTGNQAPVLGSSAIKHDGKHGLIGWTTVQRSGQEMVNTYAQLQAIRNSGTFVGCGSKITIENSDVYLYAVWGVDNLEQKFTVTYLPGEHGTLNGNGVHKDIAYGEPTPAAPGLTAEAGYEFDKWTPAVDPTVTKTAIYTAQWKPKTNTPYKVEHYLETLNGTYEKAEAATENLTGTTGASVTASSKSFDGFAFDENVQGTVKSGNIAGDGSLTLKLYYTRKSYNVTYSFGEQAPTGVLYNAEGQQVAVPTAPETSSHKQGSSVDVAGGYASYLTHDAYGNENGIWTFLGWNTNDADVQNGSFTMPNHAVAFVGSWKFETKPVATKTVTYVWEYAPADVDIYTSTGEAFTGATAPAAVTVTYNADFTAETTHNGASVDTYDVYGNINGVYGFGGWDPITIAHVTKDETVNGTWNWREKPVQTWKVTYVDGVDDEEVFANDVHPGVINKSPTPAFAGSAVRPGYEFAGWTSNIETGTFDAAAIAAKKVTTNVIYTAQWTDLKDSSYKVHYYLNGTENSVAPDDGETELTYGTTRNINALNLEGYVLVGSDTQSVTADNIGNASVTFYYRKLVTLNAASDTLEFNGTTQQVSGFTVTGEMDGHKANFSKVNVGAEGMNVNAEGYPAEFTADTVGTVDDSDKYIVAAVNSGKLVITPAPVTVTMGNLSKTYGDADPVPAEGKDIVITGLFGKDTIPYAWYREAGQDVKWDGGKVDSYPITIGLDAPMMASEGGDDGAIPYGNYKVTFTNGTLTINPKVLNIETYDGSKVYDGIPLVGTGKMDSAIGGERVTASFTTLNDVAEGVKNAYTLSWGAGTKSSNYSIHEVKLGKLSMTHSTEEIHVNVTGGTYVYDGTAHGATIAVTDIPTGYTVKKAVSNATAKNVVDGTVTAKCDELVIVDADGKDVTAFLKVVYGEAATITITPRDIVFQSANDAKQYNGTPLTNPNITIGGKYGFVAGEENGVIFNVIGAVTGNANYSVVVDNEFNWTFNTALIDPNNYSIRKEVGRLRVDPLPMHELLIHYAFEDGTEAAEDHIGWFREGEQYNVYSPVIEGFTADYLFVRSGVLGMPDANVEVTVTYTAAEPTPEPTDPGLEIIPVEKGFELEEVLEDEVPLAGGHADCILHFLLMLAALAIELVYTDKRKKYQQKIFEMKKQLGDTTMDEA